MDVNMSFDMFFGVENVYTMCWIRVGVFVAIWGIFGDVYQHWVELFARGVNILGIRLGVR